MTEQQAGREAISDRDVVQSIERGFAVLLAFDADSPNPRLTELAARTGLSRPAVRRILLTLQRLGYVTSSNGTWALTPRVLEIGQRFSSSSPLVEVAQPHLLALAEATHESASLATLDGTDAVYVARVPVRRIMSINVAVGTRVPAHATSMGHVLLAWADGATLERYFAAARLEPHTERTVTTREALLGVLGETRRLGYSIVDSELEMGLISAAVPVRDAAGAVVGALASSTSSGRSDAAALERDVVPLLLRTAEAISRELGWRA